MQRAPHQFTIAFAILAVCATSAHAQRSPEDRGVIALFDRRFLAPMYAGYLPGHWLPPGGVARLAGEPAVAAAEFFGTVARTGARLSPTYE